MKIATIIVTYNGARWIEKTLDSLSQSTIKTDVIVIDNCSTDSTRQLLRSYTDRISLIESNSNLGFGGANNIGFEKTRDLEYDYYFLLNQDAWVEPDCIEAMLNAERRDRSLGIISPLHLNGKGDNMDAGFAHYTSLSWNMIEDLMSKDLLIVPFVNAALWLIPSSILSEIGGFDSLFYHYGEDVDWANRLKYHGYKIGVATKAIGYHDREDRPKLNRIDIKAEYIYHLTELKNPNYSLFKAILKGIIAPLKKAILSYSNFVGYWTTFIQLAKALPIVYKNRIETQKKRQS